MRNLKNAALVAALAATSCTIDARSPGDERHEFTRGGPEEGADAAVPAGCVLHSDCEPGQACMNGQCAVLEPEAPDGGAPEADAAESESESESEAEAEAEAESDGGAPEPDASESESESESEAEAEAEAEADAGAPVPDGGAPSADGSVAPPADDGATAPDAGTPDAGPVCVAQPVTVVIPVPEGETVDASAKFCSTFFPGGWTCALFALGGESGREIRASFEEVQPGPHVFNACLRNCDDPVTGVWMAYFSDGLQQRGDPALTVGESVAPESLVSNGGSGANWLTDTQPFSCS